MSKGLINEIESKIAWNDMNIDETSISLSDVKRLLNELEEQAERAEELERKTERYREAIKKGINATRYTNPEVAYILTEALEGEE